MYADTITESMQKTIDETARRRSIQMKYNQDHHITPKQIVKAIKGTLPESDGSAYQKPKEAGRQAYLEPESGAFAADPIIREMTRPELEKSIENTKRLMEEAAKKLDFIQAAQYRDEMLRLQKQLELK